MSDDNSDDEMNRAERIRNRRGSRDRHRRQPDNQTTENKNGEQSSEQATNKESQQSQKSQSSVSDEGQPEDQPIKDRTHETFYLRDDLRRELRRQMGQASLDFEMEYGIDLGKNRHLRPLLLYLGTQELEQMSPSEVRETLQSVKVLDNPE